MKLSQAIREGAKLRPQGFGMLFHNNASCALAAAYEVIAGHTVGHKVADSLKVHKTLLNRFPILGRTVKHPFLKMRSDMYHVVTNLNDGHRWTREQIADWVASIEVQDEVVAGH